MIYPQSQFLNPPRLNRFIELGYLAIAWIAAFTCLVRTDYNFAFALFGYYYWITKTNVQERSQVLMIVNGALIGFDILWLTTTASHWGDEFPNAPVWNATQGLRSIVVFLSIVNIAIKAIVTLIIFLFKRTLANYPEHEALALGQADYLGQASVGYDMGKVGGNAISFGVNQYPGAVPGGYGAQFGQPNVYPGGMNPPMGYPVQAMPQAGFQNMGFAQSGFQTAPIRNF